MRTGTTTTGAAFATTFTLGAAGTPGAVGTLGAAATELLGKMGGRMAGGLARGATGVAMSFATTYAIGQVARRYYAGGRTMDAGMLKQSFASLVEEAKLLQSRYLPQIEQQSRSIDVNRIVELVKAR